MEFKNDSCMHNAGQGIKCIPIKWERKAAEKGSACSIRQKGYSRQAKQDRSIQRQNARVVLPWRVRP